MSGFLHLRALADALHAAESTRAKSAKVAVFAAALRTIGESSPEQLAFAARFLTGSLLKTDDARTLGAGGALLFEAAAAVSGSKPEELGALARRRGDLGTAVGELLEQREDAARHGGEAGAGLPLREAEAAVHTLAETSSRQEKLRALVGALRRCSPREARYFVRALLGEMRVGAREGIVVDAIAQAWTRDANAVRAAAGLLADVGEVAVLARAGELGQAGVVLGRPLGFMLATPLESAKGADLDAPHAVEDKIDGVRAQAHVSRAGVWLFARGKGAVASAFPEVTAPLAAAAAADLPEAIVDGEIVVVTSDGRRPRPFSALQPRLNKVAPDDELLRTSPVRYLVYDILFEEGQSLLALPFEERRARLVRWVGGAPPSVVLHGSRTLEGRAAVDIEFAGARGRGFEGLVLKRLDAPYAAGVRGFAWLKVKRAFATLDVVVVAAERGHGKRAGVLSDYTFAVWDGGELRAVGKAYSGLTDEEIRVMSARLEGIALAEERNGYLAVKPEVVLEVAFDGLQRSSRHASGFALRFPRIARVRDDKAPCEADKVDAVRALYEAQVASGHREEGPERRRGRASGRRPDVRQKSKQLRLFEDD